MIISASRRTDIPKFYPKWFMNRIRAGEVLVRNPRNHHQVSRILLRRELVDGIVFWTKDPIPFLPHLENLKDWTLVFQFTVTPYGPEVEPGLPHRFREIVPAFQRLSRLLGPEQVIWRYDPILVNQRYTPQFHREAFAGLAAALKGYTRQVIVSFLDDQYKGVRQNLAGLAPRSLSREEQIELAAGLARIAERSGMSSGSCASRIDLTPAGVRPASCIDGALFSRLLGVPLDVERDRNQRPECRCMASVDIGVYNSCPHGCLYCYANYAPWQVARNLRCHDPSSPFLIGGPEPGDVILDREQHSLIQAQRSFFDLF